MAGREHFLQCHILLWLSYRQSAAVLWHSSCALSYWALLSTAGTSSTIFLLGRFRNEAACKGYIIFTGLLMLFVFCFVEMDPSMTVISKGIIGKMLAHSSCVNA